MLQSCRHCCCRCCVTMQNDGLTVWQDMQHPRSPRAPYYSTLLPVGAGDVESVYKASLGYLQQCQHKTAVSYDHVQGLSPRSGMHARSCVCMCVASLAAASCLWPKPKSTRSQDFAPSAVLLSWCAASQTRTHPILHNFCAGTHQCVSCPALCVFTGVFLAGHAVTPDNVCAAEEARFAHAQHDCRRLAARNDTGRSS